MTLKPEDFSINDISHFPIVRMLAEHRTQGGHDAWATEMEKLLDHGIPFVMIGGGQLDETPEETRARALWYKEKSGKLGQMLAGMILLEPDPDKRAEIAPMVEKSARAFPWTSRVAASEDEAMAFAQEMLTAKAAP